MRNSESNNADRSLVTAPLDLLVLAALLFTGALWILNPMAMSIGSTRTELHWHLAWLLLPLVAIILRATVGGRASILTKLSLAAAMTFLFLLIAEGTLALVGYSANFPPLVISGDAGALDTDENAVVEDPELLWTFQPGTEVRGHPVNRLGFLDREVDREKAEGIIRVVCMGDSCTAQGYPPYSTRLHELLQYDAPTANDWESFNTAVHGYSSVQGLKQFEVLVQDLQPDYVTIFYGWNDHWLDFRPDSNRMALEQTRLVSKVFSKLLNKRFFQLLVKAVKPKGNMAWEQTERGPRVPPDEYRATLQQIALRVREAGATPIFITAPRAEQLSHTFVHRKNTPSIEEGARVHDEYVEITRSVADEMDVAVVDLAAAFKGEQAAAYFTQDGVHFTPEGLDAVAGELYRTLAQQSNLQAETSK